MKPIDTIKLALEIMYASGSKFNQEEAKKAQDALRDGAIIISEKTDEDSKIRETLEETKLK